MLEAAIGLLQRWAEIMPLPWFTFFGTMFEEVIAPVPSPVVMTLAGSLSASLHTHLSYLVLLALTGTAGKTIGSYVIYIIADKFEDVILGRFGKLIGVSHEQIEAIGKKLGKGWKDNVAIFVLRALPIMPTAPVSFVAGMLKMEMKGYLTSTALGVFVRNLFYLYLGYTSIDALENINSSLSSSETIGSVIVLLFVAGLFGYIYYKRRTMWKSPQETPLEKEVIE